ncbi:MAG: type II toxin-antitoxin system VapC family toxin [Dehalococcoidia bacterium]
MFVVDASVWVSAVWRRDAKHAASESWIDAALERDLTLFEPTLLLPEVAGALSRRTSRPRLAASWLTRLSAIPAIGWRSLDEEEGDRAGRVAAAFAVRGADAVYVALAEALDVPLVTWDRRQADAAGARALTPETA